MLYVNSIFFSGNQCKEIIPHEFHTGISTQYKNRVTIVIYLVIAGWRKSMGLAYGIRVQQR